jgi:hypothetical protein
MVAFEIYCTLVAMNYDFNYLEHYFCGEVKDRETNDLLLFWKILILLANVSTNIYYSGCLNSLGKLLVIAPLIIINNSRLLMKIFSTSIRN